MGYHKRSSTRCATKIAEAARKLVQVTIEDLDPQSFTCIDCFHKLIEEDHLIFSVRFIVLVRPAEWEQRLEVYFLHTKGRKILDDFDNVVPYSVCYSNRERIRVSNEESHGTLNNGTGYFEMLYERSISILYFWRTIH